METHNANEVRAVLDDFEKWRRRKRKLKTGKIQLVVNGSWAFRLRSTPAACLVSIADQVVNVRLSMIN